MEKGPGLQEIAAQAGVSAMTVSRALSGKGRIADGTRQRIAVIAAELGYRPNLLARELKQGSSCCVGMLWSMSHPYNGVELLRTLSQKLLEAGYGSLVVDSMSDAVLVRRALEDFLARRVEILLLDDRMCLEAREQFFPLLRKFESVILVKQHPFADAPFDQIVMDPRPALEEAVRFFKEQGRKHAAVLSPRLRHTELWKQLSRQYALPIEFLEPGRDWKKDLRGEIAFLEKRYPGVPPFDVFFSMVDETALLLINHLRAKGLDVPRDAAVCGFNDSVPAQLSDPPLASLETTSARLGSAIEELIFDCIRTPGRPPRRITLPLRFIPRASAGVLPDKTNHSHKEILS